MVNAEQQLPPSPARHVQAAKASWLAPVIAVVLNMFVGNNSEERFVTIAVGTIAGTIILTGLAFALWGIIGAFRKGPLWVLLPAFAGLLINGFLVYVTVGSFVAARQIAQEHRERQLIEESDEWIPSGDGWYVDRSDYFAIRFPNDWEVIPNPQDRVAVIAISPFISPEDRFRENLTIVVASISPQTNVKNLFAANQEDLRRNTAGFEEHGTGTKTLNGVEWTWIDYQQTVQGIETRVKCYLAVKSGRIYAVSCSREPTQGNTFEKTFDPTLRSIRIP